MFVFYKFSCHTPVKFLAQFDIDIEEAPINDAKHTQQQARHSPVTFPSQITDKIPKFLIGKKYNFSTLFPPLKGNKQHIFPQAFASHISLMSLSPPDT